MRITRTLLPLAATLLLALPVAAQEGEMHGDMDHAGMDHGDMMMPESGLRADLIADIEANEAKVMALAGAMADHWDWRPMDGVRSTGEVYGHLAAAGFMLPTMMGIDPPEMYQGADRQETMGNIMAIERLGHAEMMEALEHSFMHLKHAIARTSDDRLDEEISYFGQQGTVRSLMVLLASHVHEHLGQSIAYARTNHVVPPWSM